MLVLKRVIVWLAELACICISLGFLLRLLLGPFLPGGNVPTDVARYASAAAVVFVWGSGYALTTFVFAVIWRSARAWIYPTIAAGLYVVHLQLFSTAWGVHEKLPLLFLGAPAVFGWTYLGGWLLRRWRQ